MLTETLIESRHPGRSVLFERVDSFRFVSGRAGSMLVQSVACGSVTVATVRSSGHDIALEERGRTTFLTPLRGTLEIDAARSTLRCGSGGGILLRPGSRNTAVRASEADDFLGAVVTAPMIAGSGSPPAIPGVAFDNADSEPAARALRGYLTYFLGEFLQPGSLLQRPGALRASEALILDLLAELGRFDLEPAVRVAATSVDRVRLAEEYMRAHSDEPLTVGGIADAVGVGARALQIAFRAHRGLSPRMTLAQFRLDRARERLMASDPASTVSDVALLSGFAHLGRFAGAYRARFGETPSQSLRRRRG